MSESGANKSEVEKKREYNRNAQRVFRQRRKEHLQALEAARVEQHLATPDEAKRLRQENIELTRENENLKRLYRSAPGSPGLTSDPTGTRLSAISGIPPSYDSSLSQTSEELGSLCILVPHPVVEIRQSLRKLFAPLLELSVISDPRSHLATLAALEPGLPPQLKPTKFQLGTPHHAFIDMIPSPALRDRLISVGTTHANSFMTQVCTIVCDIEDKGQLTVWGEDWLNESFWEFSAPVLEQWGELLLTGEWRQRANFWRRQRGATMLP